jgi:hypothetical protein
MDPAFVAFLDGNGVSRAEYLAYDGPTKATLIAAFQNSKGNLYPTPYEFKYTAPI